MRYPEDELEQSLLEQHAGLERELEGLQGREDAGAIERRGNLTRAMERIDEQLSEARETRAQRQRIAELAKSPGNREEESQFILSRNRTERDEPTDRARRIIEEAHRSRGLHEEGAEKTERLITSGSLRDRRSAAAWVTAAGDPDYESAFRVLMGDPERGHLKWSDAQRAAWAKVEEYRAMSTTGNAGGHMIPFSLDPTVLLTNAGSISPLRQLARTVTIATDVWHGVTSEGVTAEWLAEATEAADASPTLAQPDIPVEKAAAFIPYSYEVGQDALSFAEEMSKLLIDGYDRLTAEAFMYGEGTGSGQPSGLAAGLAATAVDTDTAETLDADDVVGLQNVLPPRWQANASWIGSLAAINHVSSIETTNGSLRFPELSASPPMLLRKAVFEDSHLEAVEDATSTLTEPADVMVYGDIAQCFTIVDRIGATIEPIQNLFGASGRPTGQRGFFLHARVGSEVVIADAARLLRVQMS